MFVCSLWAALIAYWRQLPSPITLMIDRLRMCAFAVRMVLASAILMRWLRCCRRHWYALFLVLNLLSSSLARTSSAESLIACRCLVTVGGRGASLNCVSSILLWVYRVRCSGYWICCGCLSGCPCVPVNLVWRMVFRCQKSRLVNMLCLYMGIIRWPGRWLGLNNIFRELGQWLGHMGIATQLTAAWAQRNPSEAVFCKARATGHP